jgi:hypothetical protein
MAQHLTKLRARRDEMSVATNAPLPQNENIAEVHPIKAQFPLLAVVLIAISLLATLAWSGALIWLSSALIKSL